jgi:hypothetical protein
MGGIQVYGRDEQSIHYPVIWSGSDVNPVIFVVVKDGSTGLAHPDYIAGVLYDVSLGDLGLADAWDELLVKTEKLPYPQKCRVRMIAGSEGAAEILVANRIVHRFS